MTTWPETRATRRSWGQAFAVYLRAAGAVDAVPRASRRACRSTWCSPTLSALAAHRAHRTRHHRHAGLGRAHVLLQVGVGAGRRSRRLPVLDKLLGRRRSWMLVAQIGDRPVPGNLALGDPARERRATWPCSRLASRSSPPRRTSPSTPGASSRATADKQGAMAAAYQIGYRTALMVASAGALIIAGEFGDSRPAT